MVSGSRARDGTHTHATGARLLLGVRFLSYRSPMTWNPLQDDASEVARGAVQGAGGLCCQVDLARRWGVSRARVHQIVREAEFPQPVGVVASREVWLVSECDLYRRRRDLLRAMRAVQDASAGEPA